MAEVIARRMVRERGWTDVEVESAGVAAFDGSTASGGAVRAAAAAGLDLTDHEARLLTGERAEAADLILTMSSSHLFRVMELGAGERAAVITAFGASDDAPDRLGGVPDPIGGPDAEYERTFAVLEELIARAMERIEPMVDS